MKLAILMFLILTCALIVRGGAYPATARVTLLPRVEVRPARPVTIKDIARVEAAGEPARKIGAITIASGPMPGKTARIEAGYIRLRLSGEIKGRVEVRGPERVELVGKSLKFGPEALSGAAKDFLLGQLPRDGRTYDVEIDRAPREIVVAAGSSSELRTRMLNPTLRPGVVAVAVDVVVDERVAASATVALTVKAVADVLVASKPIRQGETITADNSTWDRREVTRTPIAVTQADESDGWIARRSLAAGALITLNDIAPPYAVRRGDTAAVTVTCGRVTLRTTGEIKQDARTGELVRVRPAASNEDVQAKVLGAGTVSIAR